MELELYSGEKRREPKSRQTETRPPKGKGELPQEKCIQIKILPFLKDFKQSLERASYDGKGLKGEFVSKKYGTLFGSILEMKVEISEEMKQEETREWTFLENEPKLSISDVSSPTPDITKRQSSLKKDIYDPRKKEEEEEEEEREEKSLSERKENPNKQMIYGFFSSRQSRSQTLNFKDPKFFQNLNKLIKEIELSFHPEMKKTQQEPTQSNIQNFAILTLLLKEKKNVHYEKEYKEKFSYPKKKLKSNIIGDLHVFTKTKTSTTPIWIFDYFLLEPFPQPFFLFSPEQNYKSYWFLSSKMNLNTCTFVI